MTGRHAGRPVSLADADRRVLSEFVEQDAKYGFQRTYAKDRFRPTPSEELVNLLPPLSFQDETLRVLIDANKGFPEPPVQHTYDVLRELQVLRPPTADELAVLAQAHHDGFTTVTPESTFDVIDEAVFNRLFPEHDAVQ